MNTEAAGRLRPSPELHEEYFRTYYSKAALLGEGWLTSRCRHALPGRALRQVAEPWKRYDAQSQLQGRAAGSDRSFFNCREFAFEAGKVFARYVSFKVSLSRLDCLAEAAQDAKALRDFLVQRCPQKIDIGAVYNVDPAKRSTYTGLGDGFYCKERELVFDIDMDEYDDVRTCCQEGKMCRKDWSYMAAAIQVIDAGLREDFGFEHILWVYSGRRGVHCWVCDQRARGLSDKERSAVADYLTVYKGHQKGGIALNVSNIAHPSIQRAYKICSAIWFERVLPEQGLFESESHTRAMYDIIRDPKIEASVSQSMSRCEGDPSQWAWQCILDEVKKLESSQKERKRFEELNRRLEKVVFSHVYPRLDILVSRTRNHLLKAPFCVHPKTGRICVPVSMENLWEFSPEEVVTVKQLYDQMEENYRMERASGVEGTMLYPYIAQFSRFVSEMETSNGRCP